MIQGELQFGSRVETESREWLATADGKATLTAVVDHARRLRARGFNHYSADAIFHALRFSRDVRLGPDHGYKLNDRRTAYIAREVMRRYPDLAGFFETRKLRGR